MSLEPVRFGRSDREMVGMLHRPEVPQGKPAFLLCKPFGTEAIRASLLYRAMATRLVREGCPVLVFDYHGTGDAAGEGGTQSIRDWCEDVLTANAFLRERTAATRTHWFGLALGGSVVALAAAQAALADAVAARPEQIVLWEPVEDGQDYGRQLCAWHRIEREQWFKARWQVLRQDFNEPEPALPGTVLGFDVGPILAQELAALEHLPIASLLDAGIRVTLARPGGSGGSAGSIELPPSPSLRRLVSEHPFNWMSNHPPKNEEYRGAEIVPQDIVRSALETLRSHDAIPN
jgi:pimeloyl-ACP methyl ester carboxylesterase